MILRRRSRLTAQQRAAVARVLADPIFEVIPLRNLDGPAAHLPAGSRVSVTSSPAKGLGPTLDWTERLAEAGHTVIPHLAARSIRDRSELADVLARLRAAGVTQAFVVGGDGDRPGAFPDGLALLGEMRALGHPFTGLGCPGYPDGHATIPAEVLAAALAAKAPHLHNVTTQMGFDPGSVASWVEARRKAGMTLDVIVGVPGVVDPARLMAIAARIGVRDTRRFVGKNLRVVGGLARGGGLYRPTRFVEGLAPLLADPVAGVTGLHLFTFNGVQATDAWRRKLLEGVSD